MRTLALLLVATLCLHAQGAETRTAQRIDRILAGDHRSSDNKHRDQYRHPAQTLAFFGIEDTQTVVEIFPGNGWYTEILAPLLKPYGKLYEASYSEDSPSSLPYQKKATASLKNRLAARPDLYDAVTVTVLQTEDHTDIAPPGSVDMVLTFRNVHNWLAAGNADAVFAAMFRALKPGGVLGVVEHRAKAGTTLRQSIDSGYVTEDDVIFLAEKAGFVFAAKSEINANPKDTKDYPGGVWTLPPTLAGVGDARDKYLAIGESDRMTMKFYKPR
jgi:predicted methyltransferase